MASLGADELMKSVLYAYRSLDSLCNQAVARPSEEHHIQHIIVLKMDTLLTHWPPECVVVILKFVISEQAFD